MLLPTSIQVARSSIVIVITLFITACGIKYTMDDIPKEDDFRLNKKALLENYPAVMSMHPDYKRYPAEGIYYDDLVKAWGEPRTKQISWRNSVPFYASINVAAYYVPIYLSWEPFALINGMGLLVFDADKIVWKKDNYQVETTFLKEPFSFSDSYKLIDWKWKHIEKGSATDWLKKDPQRFFIGYSFGFGEGRRRNMEGDLNTYINGTYNAFIGYRVVFNETMSMSTSVGYEAAYWSEPDGNYELSYNPVNLSFNHKLGRDWLSGTVGVQYLHAPSLEMSKRFSGRVVTTPLESRVAWFFGLDMDANAHNTLSLRHRIGKLSGEDGRERNLEASYLTFIFRF